MSQCGDPKQPFFIRNWEEWTDTFSSAYVSLESLEIGNFNNTYKYYHLTNVMMHGCIECYYKNHSTDSLITIYYLPTFFQLNLHSFIHSFILHSSSLIDFRSTPLSIPPNCPLYWQQIGLITWEVVDTFHVPLGIVSTCLLSIEIEFVFRKNTSFTRRMNESSMETNEPIVS
jgi:hypothetical protein